MAQVAAIDIEHYEKIPVAGIYSYGSPRAFSHKLKKKFQKQFGSHAHRWVNNNDLVTGVPPACCAVVAVCCVLCVAVCCFCCVLCAVCCVLCWFSLHALETLMAASVDRIPSAIQDQAVLVC